MIVPALLVSGCGSSNGDQPAATAASPTDASLPNACPVDGCQITITDVRAEGDELRLTWTANYSPDFSKNHIHVYWDTYTADQVTNDAAARGTTQGEWVPTADFPEFLTEGPVSTSARGTSTTICVTAGDRDHNVIDSSIVNCRDVADLL
jgi:hypothetical protein